MRQKKPNICFRGSFGDDLDEISITVFEQEGKKITSGFNNKNQDIVYFVS